MTNILKLVKAMKRHINGLLETMDSGINSTTVNRLTKKVWEVFKSSDGFKIQEYFVTITCLATYEIAFPKIN